MENKQFLEKLKFGIGDGNLQYYLYNWKCPAIEPEKVHFFIGAIKSIVPVVTSLVDLTELFNF
jgi:hypothetical protein